MKRHWVCLELRFEALKDVMLEMLWRRVALSGNTSLLVAVIQSADHVIPSDV